MCTVTQRTYQKVVGTDLSTVNVCYINKKKLGISQWVNQSINQPTNQPINWSVKQSINQSVNQSISQSANQPINQSVNQSTKQALLWSKRPGFITSMRSVLWPYHNTQDPRPLVIWMVGHTHFCSNGSMQIAFGITCREERYTGSDIQMIWECEYTCTVHLFIP